MTARIAQIQSMFTRQHVLTHVGERLEPREREEPAGALDGVDGAEDRGDERTRRRVLLERHEVAVEVVEVLVALDEELLADVVQALGEDGRRLGHPRPRKRLWRPGSDSRICRASIGRSRPHLSESSACDKPA